MAQNSLGLNQVFPIYNADNTPFEGLVLRKSAFESTVMSLGDKITGDVYYKDNNLAVTMQEYIEYEGVHYVLVNPPTIVREGLVKDNGNTGGMTKYSFTFYHPMYMLSNFPFSDVAVSADEEKYLSQNKTFSWIGKPQDYIDKLNKNLQGTTWVVRLATSFPLEKMDKLSEVLSFDNNTIAEALKTGYDTWEVPYIVSQLSPTDAEYANNKRFVIEFGLPSQEIYASEYDRQMENPFVFRFGQGVGLKNSSRTPKNNKIVTRIAGYGSEENIPYGYPQIIWAGDSRWEYTKYIGEVVYDENDKPTNAPAPDAYPLYDGIANGQRVKLIKHPFTRTHLMPSIYTETVNKKVNPYATGYNPSTVIVDYYDATQEEDYPNPIVVGAPSYEIHEFEDIKPELDSERSLGILSATPLNKDLTPASSWDDSLDEEGEYVQSYFSLGLPQLSFDLYACAAITQSMKINMRGGACIGCTFEVQVDWEDYKLNFYDEDGNFDPYGSRRDMTKYPNSATGAISIIVKKDLDTFGTIMPNIYQYPQANDTFVILGISLPLSYVTDAQERLDADMKEYMRENNTYKYEYPLKFDEHFLLHNQNILSQIRPNSVINFEYNSETLKLYVQQVAIKFGDNVLPQYDIKLTDNIEVVLNPIGTAMNEISNLYLDKRNLESNIKKIQKESGPRGKMGRNLYFAGSLSDVSEYYFAATDYEAPYVKVGVDENDKPICFVYVGSNTDSKAFPTLPNVYEDSSEWALMTTEFKYLITEAIFSAFATLGSWTFNADYMFSEKGIDDNGNVVSRGNLDYYGIGDSDNEFTPSAAFDAFTGQASLSRDKVRLNPDGSGWLADGTITWDSLGNTKFTGRIATPYTEREEVGAAVAKSGCIIFTNVSQLSVGYLLPYNDLSFEGIELNILNYTNYSGFISCYDGANPYIYIGNHKANFIVLRTMSFCIVKGIKVGNTIRWIILNPSDFEFGYYREVEIAGTLTTINSDIAISKIIPRQDQP